MKRTFLISDNHFGHRNILTFYRSNGQKLREFVSVEEMDQHMIKCWNSVVMPEDKVYHLGDFSLCSPAHYRRIIEQLNGDKVLIKGNHDTLELKLYALYFRDVRAYHIIGDMLLSHIPILEQSLLQRFRGQIHGHTHAESVNNPRYFNVSAEVLNYTPILLDKVKHKLGVDNGYSDHNN